MWRQLGIETERKTVRFVEDAPLAPIRRAISSVPESKAAAPAAFRPSAVFVGRSAASAARNPS
jgi:hypothetical protein